MSRDAVRKRKSEQDLGMMLQQEEAEEEEQDQYGEADWSHYVELTENLTAEQEDEDEDGEIVLELTHGENPVSSTTSVSSNMCSFEDQQEEDSLAFSQYSDQPSKVSEGLII